MSLAGEFAAPTALRVAVDAAGTISVAGFGAVGCPSPACGPAVPALASWAASAPELSGSFDVEMVAPSTARADVVRAVLASMNGRASAFSVAVEGDSAAAQRLPQPGASLTEAVFASHQPLLTLHVSRMTLWLGDVPDAGRTWTRSGPGLPTSELVAELAARAATVRPDALAVLNVDDDVAFGDIVAAASILHEAGFANILYAGGPPAPQITVSGIAAAAVREVVTQHLPELRYCWSRASKGVAEGGFVVALSIAPDGASSSVSIRNTTPENPLIAACAKDVAERMRFAPSGRAAMATVTLEFAQPK